MWKKQDIIRTTFAIVIAIAVLGILRLLHPSFNYFPPEELINKLERSWFVEAGVRKFAMAGYGTVALVMMAIFFKVTQARWPGRGNMKGLAFGASIGILWYFGFLTGWLFLGTTLKAEILNGTIDLVGLAVGGWLIGKAIGRDVPKSGNVMWRPWLAVIITTIGFVSIHTLGAMFLVRSITLAPELLLVPSTLPQYALLSGLGIWAGLMFVMIQEGLPFQSSLARAALFAFGIFGHSWIWFQLFLVIVDFSEMLLPVLLVSLIGASGVFAGTLAYEGIAGWRRQVD
jgi:hypothetical protein